PEIHGRLQRNKREGGNSIKGKFQHLAERILGLPCAALFSREGYPRLSIANPTDQAAYEAAPFSRGLHSVHHTATQQAEIASIKRNINLCQPPEEGIKERGGTALEKVFPGALPPHCVDNIVAVPPFLDEIQDQFRWVLEISIHNDDGIP